MKTINIKLVRDNAVVPKFATEGSAAVDVCAAIDSAVTIHPGETKKIPLGFALELPIGYGAFLLPRSGLGANHGVVLGNLVGLCDPDYRGEYVAPIWIRQEGQAYTVNPGDRIAQMVILPVLQNFSFVEVQDISETERGAGGFGSTGIA